MKPPNLNIACNKKSFIYVRLNPWRNILFTRTIKVLLKFICANFSAIHVWKLETNPRHKFFPNIKEKERDKVHFGGIKLDSYTKIKPIIITTVKIRVSSWQFSLGFLLKFLCSGIFIYVHLDINRNKLGRDQKDDQHNASELNTIIYP